MRYVSREQTEQSETRQGRRQQYSVLRAERRREGREQKAECASPPLEKNQYSVYEIASVGRLHMRRLEDQGWKKCEAWGRETVLAQQNRIG